MANMEEIRAHVATFLLLSIDHPIRIELISSNMKKLLFPIKTALSQQVQGYSTPDLISFLESDVKIRFKVESISGSHEVSRNSLTLCADDGMKIEQIEKWRNVLELHLKSSNAPVHLNKLGKWLTLPPTLKLDLADTIIFDSKGRFQLVGEPPCCSVKLHDNFIIDGWLTNIANYLLEKRHCAGLNEIAQQNPKPNNLSKSVKLLESLRNDSFQRFHIEGEGSDGREVRVRVKLQPADLDQITNHWKTNLAQFLLKQGVPMTLSVVGGSVSRPHQLPPEVKLLNVMKSDPSCFVLKGEGNNITVQLSKSFKKAAFTFNDNKTDAQVYDPLIEDGFSYPTYSKSHKKHIEIKQKQILEVEPLGEPLGFPGSMERAIPMPRPRILRESSGMLFDELMCCHSKKQPPSSIDELSLGTSPLHSSTSYEKNSTSGLFLNPGELSLGISIPLTPSSNVVDGAATNDDYREHRNFQEDTTYDSFINCDVCFEQFSIDPDNSPKRPKLLACLHTFCLACLFSLASKQEYHFITCPTCREVTPLGPRGIRGLGNNYFLENFLASISVSGNCKFKEASLLQPSHTAGMSSMTDTLSTACRNMMPEKDTLPLYETNPTQTRTFTSWAPVGISTTTPNAMSPVNAVYSMEWSQLDKWLPTILKGYDRALVTSFINDLRDEFGVVSTEDLVNLSSSGQLTFEVLGKIKGFKIGHFNRLVIGLEKISQV